MSGLTFLVFDMDEVLYDYDHSIRLELLADLTGRPAAAIDADVWGGPHEARAEAGTPGTAEGYLAQFAELLGHPIDFDTWAEVRRKMMRPRLEVLDLVRTAAKNVDVALLTNNGMLLKQALPVCAPDVLEIFGEKAHVSAEFGARKPDPEVYLRICRRYGHDPAQTGFVDDRPDNVAGAQAAGLAAHLYRTADGLKGFLQTRGLLP